MKALLTWITCVFFTLPFLGACTSAPKKFSETAEVPQERVFLKQSSDSQTATAIFVRDVGGTVSAKLLVNDELASELFNGEKVSLQLPAGEYMFGFYLGPKAFLITANPIDQRLEAGKTYFYRISGDPMNGPRIFRAIGKLAE